MFKNVALQLQAIDAGIQAWGFMINEMNADQEYSYCRHQFKKWRKVIMSHPASVPAFRYWAKRFSDATSKMQKTNLIAINLARVEADVVDRFNGEDDFEQYITKRVMKIKA